MVSTKIMSHFHALKLSWSILGLSHAHDMGGPTKVGLRSRLLSFCGNFGYVHIVKYATALLTRIIQAIGGRVLYELIEHPDPTQNEGSVWALLFYWLTLATNTCATSRWNYMYMIELVLC